MTFFTEREQKAISDHCRDFNADTYAEFMRKAGGFDAYVGALCLCKPSSIRTVSDFRQAVRYVFALLCIWGPDYSNSNDGSGHYYRWGQGSADAFRRSGKGKCAGGDLRKILGDPSIVTTNCNYGADTLLRALGWYKAPTAYVSDWMRKYGSPVLRKADLQPGDLVHFYRDAARKSWKHVAIVYAVQDGKVWLVDFGSRFIKSKNPLHYMPIDTKATAGGEYSGYWRGIHAFDLEDDMRREKTIADKAVEMRREIESFLSAKRKEYGTAVSLTTEDYKEDPAKYLRAAAGYVLNGYAGSGEARKAFFGEDYASVQEKVNWVIKTAEEVLDGKYGAGEARREALGPDYQVVQDQVNRIIEGR